MAMHQDWIHSSQSPWYMEYRNKNIYTMTVSSRPKYVPKGGHLVDFEKRLTPKLKRILSKEKQEGALVHNHADVHDSTCMAMVLWSGTDGMDQTAHVDDHTVKEAAKPCVASKPATA